MPVLLIVMACAAGGNAMAEQRPPASRSGSVLSEFLGTWVFASAKNTNCRRDDWKGTGQHENTEMINVTASAFEGWENGCKILSARPRSRDRRRTVEVKLSCSGDGFTWKSSEIWHVQQVGDRRVFVQTEISSSNRRDDSGKKYPDSQDDPTTLFLECK